MLPKEFEYYFNKRIVRKVGKNEPRARFLKEEAGVSLAGLKERIKIIGINNKNANSIIKDCYDILIGLTRAKFLLDGYSSSGNYAHEAEISYLKKIGFLDNEVSFLNELRYFRNSIMYYGKILDKEYAENVFSFLNKILLKLMDLK